MALPKDGTPTAALVDAHHQRYALRTSIADQNAVKKAEAEGVEADIRSTLFTALELAFVHCPVKRDSLRKLHKLSGEYAHLNDGVAAWKALRTLEEATATQLFSCALFSRGCCHFGLV